MNFHLVHSLFSTSLRPTPPFQLTEFVPSTPPHTQREKETERDTERYTQRHKYTPPQAPHPLAIYKMPIATLLGVRFHTWWYRRINHFYTKIYCCKCWNVFLGVDDNSFLWIYSLCFYLFYCYCYAIWFLDGQKFVFWKSRYEAYNGSVRFTMHDG